ncbi:MAG TPA: tripartite tricarboxylate transporter substrate binding protein [Burkholderiales bacterium]|nr:tripartite tricarboxylate transporter substrate binding protein [Burkholderiales bacterium]
MLEARRVPAAFAAAVLLSPCAAGAQEFPSRVVRLVVAGPPGGAADSLARTVAQKLTVAWKRQVIVDNRPGASGQIGTDFVAKAVPDGHTFMIGHNGTHAINPALRQKLPFDPVADFVPITLAAKFPNVVLVHPSLPVRSVKALISMAKAQPGQLAYGTSGVGFPQHLAAEFFSAKAGIKMLHVPYKGSAAALVDGIAGNVPILFPNLVVALPHMASGRLLPLGVTSLKRSAAAPQVPTVSEAALPGYEVTTWFGFLAPAAVPPEIVRELHSATTHALRQPEVQAIVASQGGDVVASTGSEFGAFIKAELSKWAAIIKWSGASAE